METMRKSLRTILAICLISLLVACATTASQLGQPSHQEDSSKVVKVKTGETFKAPADGWFITDEAAANMLRAIEYYKYRWMECEEAK